MFRKKLAQAIVKARYILTICILAAAAISCTTISKTRINYDLNRYLADDTMTKRALAVMEQEFGSAEQLRIMFADLTEEQLSFLRASAQPARKVLTPETVNILPRFPVGTRCIAEPGRYSFRGPACNRRLRRNSDTRSQP